MFYVAVGTPVNLLDIFVARMELESREVTEVLNLDDLAVGDPGLSNRGDWMVYTEHANPNARLLADITFRPFPDVLRTQVPLGPGTHPVFSRDGDEVFYYDGRGIAAANPQDVWEAGLRALTQRDIPPAD